MAVGGGRGTTRRGGCEVTDHIQVSMRLYIADGKLISITFIPGVLGRLT